MNTILFKAATLGVALILGATISRAQAPTAEESAVLATLGPDGFASAPPLDALVEASAAAIIGRVVGTDGLTLREGVGYAGYRIAVDEVLFARSAAGVPPLVAGTDVSLSQRVGRDSAERFLARRLPVAATDTCLLFLGARPAGMALEGWSVQFRRAPGTPPTAETLGAPSLAAEMTKPHWFGPAVRMVDTPRGAAPEWASLLAAVRRLGTVDASAARQR
jgi:hypothetical protein